jgi:hypothetical protein
MLGTALRNFGSQFAYSKKALGEASPGLEKRMHRQRTICKDRISEALGLLSLLRVLEKSQATLHLPPLRLPDDEFQCFSALMHRIQVWLEEMKLAPFM